MTTDEIMLFDKWPNVLPLYAALREKEPERIRVLDGSGSIEEVFARTQAAAADFLNTKE